MHYLIPSIISGLGWGVVPLIDRYSLKYVDALTLVSVRSIILGLCGLILFTILKLTKKNQLQSGYNLGKSKFVITMILAPVIAFSLGHMGNYIALGRSPSSISQITLISRALIIIIVTLLAVCIYRDKINLKMIIGIIITLIGLSITIMCNPNH
jgi:drug/metabolite transporter (DMT)-like permease